MELLERGLHGLLERFNTLQRKLLFKYGLHTVEDEDEQKRRGLPRHPTGAAPALMGTSAVDPPTQQTQRNISEQK